MMRCMNNAWLLLVATLFSLPLYAEKVWSDAELALLRSLSIQNLPPLPADPGNLYADNPQAARLGHHLFFDKQLSATGDVSCATCHQPGKWFTDGRKVGKGNSETRRNTPSIIGAAYSPWYFWDGRSDSLWSQALRPLEAHAEHGGNRLHYAHLIFSRPLYKTWYESIFGKLPDLTNKRRFPHHGSPAGTTAERTHWQSMHPADQDAISRIFSNIGKAIAAYERQLLPGPSRFDQYVAALGSNTRSYGDFNEAEISGLKLFIGKGRCTTCHVGPLFSNHSFHNIGTPHPESRKPAYIPAIVFLYMSKPVADNGRYEGLPLAHASEFNCMGAYSDATEHDCAELKYANPDHRVTLGAFKVPSLRNVAHTAPYMHSGVFANLNQVIRHYSRAPMAPVGHSELTPLNLSRDEAKALIAFLKTLDSPPATPANLLKPPSL